MAQAASTALHQFHAYPAQLLDTRCIAPQRGAPASRLTLRPVLPQDGLLLSSLLQRLSPEARRQRFHGAVKLSAQRLQQMCCVDYQRDMALVVTTVVAGQELLLADARYRVAGAGQPVADMAVMVDEGWQRRGVGTWALRGLVQAATQAGLPVLQGEVLHDNQPMLALMRRCGFAVTPDAEDPGLVVGQRRLVGPLCPPAPRRSSLWTWLVQRHTRLLGQRVFRPAAGVLR